MELWGRVRRVRPWLAQALYVAATLAASHGAGHATALTIAQLAEDEAILSSVNLVNFGDYAPTNETEGPVIVGGDMTGSSHNICFNGCNGADTTINGQNFGALTVYGNMNGGTVTTSGSNTNIYVQGTNAGTLSPQHSGNVYVGGGNTSTGVITNANAVYTAKASIGGSVTNSGAVHTNQTPAAVSPFGTSLSSLQSGLQTLADQLIALATQYPAGVNTLPTSLGNLNYSPTKSVTLGGKKYAFVTTTLANLETNGQNFGGIANGAGDAATIVVVTGGGVPNGALYNLNQTSNKVIWDFGDVTSLAFAGQWYGTILAPDATITSQGGDLNGPVIVNQINQSNELHFYDNGGFQFAGDLSGLPTADPASAVPEPATLALLAAGIAGLAGLRAARRGPPRH